MYILSKFDKSKKPANLNYHMSIKKSQAILKRFIDLKFFSFGLHRAQKMKACLWHVELFLGRLLVYVFKTLNDRQSGIFNKFDLSRNPSQSKLSYVDKEKSSDPEMLYRSHAQVYQC